MTLIVSTRKNVKRYILKTVLWTQKKSVGKLKVITVFKRSLRSKGKMKYTQYTN